MAFLSNFLPNAVTNLVGFFSEAVTAFTVQELESSKLSRYAVLEQHEMLFLYKGSDDMCMAVLQQSQSASKAFVIFHDIEEKESMQLFEIFTTPLSVLVHSCAAMLNKETLQQFSNLLRAHPTWNAAHIAVKLKHFQCLSHQNMSPLLNKADSETGITPIMIAIEADDVDGIKNLITLGAWLDVTDNRRRTVFHYAVRADNGNTINLLASTNKIALNGCDVVGETALHEACLEGRSKCAEALLYWGADPLLTNSYRFPIHCAMMSSNDSVTAQGPMSLADVFSCMNCEKNVLANKASVDNGLANFGLCDLKHNGTPLHWAERKESIKRLIELGSSIDERTKDGLTALHIMVQRNRYDCAMALLIAGADATAVDDNRNSAVHMAVEADNWELVQLLIAFGADVNVHNSDGVTARHLAATIPTQSTSYIIFILHFVGAERCSGPKPPRVDSCQDGCSVKGSFDGLPRSPKTGVAECYQEQRVLFSKAITDLTLSAARAREQTAAEARSASKVKNRISFSQATGNDNTTTERWGPRPTGDRILCLDGGGVKGLVLVQILLAIEKAVGRPIVECFDWIGGSSTGAILALALVHGRKSARMCLGLYFELSTAIFVGKRPYNSELFEVYLQNLYGEKLTMDAVTYPRVVATAVLGNRFPAQLHLFRNYEFPGEEQERSANTSVGKAAFEVHTKPSEQPVWAVARATGAAPTYFRASGPFLDGGIMANNPTLDVLTEVLSYYTARNTVDNMKVKPERPVHLVVSVGTGCQVMEPADVWDIFRPEGWSDVSKIIGGVKTLLQHIITEMSESDGRIVERAAAWCNMIDVPYFRFCPQLWKNLQLDCNDEKELVAMLWETLGYIHGNRERINELVSLLVD